MIDPDRVKQRLGRLPDFQSGWSSLLPSAFVIAALIALLIAPLTVQSRLEGLREEIDTVAEPARDLLVELRYLIARQTASLRGYLITSDPAFLERYAEFVAREEAIHPQLERLAAELGSDIEARVEEIERLTIASRATLAPSDRPAPDGQASGSVGIDQEIYVGMLEATAQAELAIRGEILARTQEIRAVEQMVAVVYSLLVLLALGAALAVALLNMRIRRLATAANERGDALASSLDETERAVEARSHLIRGFTHDVKNPLGAADGFAELLEAGIRGPLSPEQADTIRRIRRSIRSALEIIDELLDLSRLESGGLRTVREPVDLPALVGESVRQHAMAASSAGVDLTFTAGTTSDAGRVYTDPDRVTQIVGNLVSNAIKYTPAPGRVAVEVVEREGDGAPHAGRWLAVTVRDTGPGIPANELERIFDEFHRVPGAPGAGHGLGLAISRGIARHLGGDVSVVSELGRGSAFTLWLPVRGEDADPAAPANDRAGASEGKQKG